MKIYNKWEKIEKPIIELSKQVKKSKAHDENIMRGIKLILGEEAHSIVSYLEDALLVDTEYLLPKREKEPASKPIGIPDLSEVENTISERDECIKLIEMIMSMLPPGIFAPDDHYRVMGEIFDYYKMKDFNAIKEIIIANWHVNDVEEEPVNDEAKEEPEKTIEVDTTADISDQGYAQIIKKADIDLTEFYPQSYPENVNKFISFGAGTTKEISKTEECWIYTFAMVITGVLTPLTMTMDNIKKLSNEIPTAVAIITSFLKASCLPFEIDVVLVKLLLKDNIDKMAHIINVKARANKLSQLRKYCKECKKPYSKFDIMKIVTMISEDIMGVEIPNATEDTYDMIMSLIESEKIAISGEEVKDFLEFVDDNLGEE